MICSVNSFDWLKDKYLKGKTKKVDNETAVVVKVMITIRRNFTSDFDFVSTVVEQELSAIDYLKD